MNHIFYIGVDGKQVVTSQVTQDQIDQVRALECGLQDGSDMLTWDAFDDPANSRTLFRAIVRDRRLRVDEKTFMADRPAFCVVTAFEGRAVRLEYYEGHDALSLRYDVRAKELEGKDLPNFMDKDPQAYDPVAFLKEAFGIPEGVSRPVLDMAHMEADSKRG
jgi:hypothetical protein